LRGTVPPSADGPRIEWKKLMTMAAKCLAAKLANGPMARFFFQIGCPAALIFPAISRRGYVREPSKV